MHNAPFTPAPHQLYAMVVFARVVEARSFSAAAERLGLSKSAISKQIKRLESDLGASLLRRTTRSLSVTHAGELLYERASQAIALFEQASGKLSEQSHQPHGKLRVTAPVTYGRVCVVPRLTAFLQRYPRIELQLVLLDRPVDLAAEGFDLAIRLVPKLPGDVIARPLGRSGYTLVAKPGLFTRRTQPREPSDLKHVNCLRYEATERLSIWQFTREGTTANVRVTGNMVVNNSEALRELALQGIGVAVLPDFLAESEIKRGRLERLLSGWHVTPPFATDAHIVWLPDRYRTPAMQAFVDFMIGAS
ncbi:MAG TPA: LysR substrate-binding domain-containing protein [Steroidobacteraceae bacterium]|nr:LysR substrate-binding domain-containing protein [Steroidobacteraceae bacterium]